MYLRNIFFPNAIKIYMVTSIHPIKQNVQIEKVTADGHHAMIKYSCKETWYYSQHDQSVQYTKNDYK
jgi:hypothetical protein